MEGTPLIFYSERQPSSKGSIQAQIDYSRLSDRWILPDLYYTIIYELADGTTIRFMMIDTPLHCDRLGSRG